MYAGGRNGRRSFGSPATGEGELGQDSRDSPWKHRFLGNKRLWNQFHLGKEIEPGKKKTHAAS
jgi:hypothetical protein